MTEGKNELAELSGTTTHTSASAQDPIAPWWHTALFIVLIVGLSFAEGRRLHKLGGAPSQLSISYLMSIGYEWTLAALALWGIRMRRVPLRQLLGERRPGLHAWLEDFAVALLYWIVAIVLLSLLGQLLLHGSGSHIDPNKIGDVTQKLAPVTGTEMALFLVLSVSAGICEELVFRGYLQQQLARLTHSVWAGVALSALVFGSAHDYEGVAGMLLIAAYGGMFGVLAILRRRLRTGMIAHAWHDSISGVALVLLRHYGVHLGSR